MKPRNIIVLAGSSDIGSYLATYYARSGVNVVATYRSRSTRIAKLEEAGIVTVPLDLSCPRQLDEFCGELNRMKFGWDALISASGVLAPIGPFFSLDFKQWENSVLTNSLDQLRAVHALYRLERKDVIRKILFFAGGGTNGPMDNYSAYCVGKIMLIKMSELLHSEYPDLQVATIGTGWVNTKIHDQTLAAGDNAGPNFERTRTILDSQNSTNITSFDDISECVEWCLNAPREAVGGRNFSLVHDAWRTNKFVEKLVADGDSHKLRRFAFDQNNK